jgi:hypothetical protein
MTPVDLRAARKADISVFVRWIWMVSLKKCWTSSPVRIAINVLVVGASKNPRSMRTLHAVSASMSFNLKVTSPRPELNRCTVTEPAISIGLTEAVHVVAALVDDEPVVGDADGVGDGDGVALGFADGAGLADELGRADGVALGDGDAAMTAVAPKTSAATAAIPAILRMVVPLSAGPPRACRGAMPKTRSVPLNGR